MSQARKVQRHAHELAAALSWDVFRSMANSMPWWARLWCAIRLPFGRL